MNEYHRGYRNGLLASCFGVGALLMLATAIGSCMAEDASACSEGEIRTCEKLSFQECDAGTWDRCRPLYARRRSGR